MVDLLAIDLPLLFMQSYSLRFHEFVTADLEMHELKAIDLHVTKFETVDLNVPEFQAIDLYVSRTIVFTYLSSEVELL